MLNTRFRLITDIGSGGGEQILVCRLIDRPIRPMIAHGFHNETQILVWVSPKRFGLLELDLLGFLMFVTRGYVKGGSGVP